MERKIKDKAVPVSEFQSAFYDIYKEQIMYLWGKRKEESVYVVNQEMENKIEELLNAEESQIIYLVGNAGVGKTMFVKNTFGISDTAVKLNVDKHTIYAPLNFRGQPMKMDIQQFLNNYLFLLCNKLESMIGNSDIAQKDLEFYSFIEANMNFLFNYVPSKELARKDAEDQCSILLHAIKEKDMYHYYIAKLAYLLLIYGSQFHNFVFVVDDIETFAKDAQENIVRDMLSLFSNMLDITSTNKQMPAFFLFFCMRGATYHYLQCCENISAFQPKILLELNCPVDIEKYLQAKFASLAYSEELKEKWNDSKEIMGNFINKFGRKYSRMFNHLSNYEFDSVKRCYRKVLTNKLWLLRGERGRNFIEMSVTDHLFNNISVIRSLACGNNAVYRNEKSSILPNILLNNELYDDSIESLLILKYIIENRRVATDKLGQMFELIFSGCTEMHKKVDRIIEHLLECNVIEEEAFRTQNGVKKVLKILPRGQEIFEMLSADSVLIELYKEDHYYSDEFNNQNEIYYNYFSSFDMMNDVDMGQKELFIQLLHYIKMLLLQEKEIHKKAAQCERLDIFYDCFQNRLMSSYLLEGVLKSVEYSGNMYVDSIHTYVVYLRRLMQDIDWFDESVQQQ